jgi:polyphosphate kinase
MVVRNDGGKLNRYVHIGTGNYNPRTARIYEDYGLLSTDPKIGDDVASLFNHLSGYGVQGDYNRLIVAPKGLRSGLISRIEREIDHVKNGKLGHIRFKCNSIVDETIIDALYRASQAGVKVDILVRGICSIRPGVPGYSDNIRVRSVLGRFLEHSRVYDFANGGEGETWIGSADLMHRNLDRRVEVLVRMNPENAKAITEVVDLGMSDNTASWHLHPNGEWVRKHLDEAGEPLVEYQEFLIANHPVAKSAADSPTPRRIDTILNKVGFFGNN